MDRIRIEIWLVGSNGEERVFEIVHPVGDHKGLIRTLDFIKAGVEDGREEERSREAEIRPDSGLSVGESR